MSLDQDANNVSTGVVTRVDGDYVWVEIGDSSGCGNCKTRDGCGSGLLGFTAPSRQRRLFNSVGAKPGDAVTLSLPDGGVLKAALLAYVLPLAFGLAGAAIGMWLGGGDGHALTGLASGLGSGWLLLRRLTRRREPWTKMGLKPTVRTQIIQLRTFEES